MQKTKRIAIICAIVCITIWGCISFTLNPFSTTIKTTETLNVDETEITVGAWATYYKWIQDHQGIIAAQRVMPDSSELDPDAWSFLHCHPDKPYTSGLINMQTNLSLDSFCIQCDHLTRPYNASRTFPKGKNCPIIDYPITGITYEQAQAFCRWRTIVTGENKVKYRLPTPEEWKTYALTNGHPDSVTNNSEKCIIYNYRFNNPCAAYIERGITSPRVLRTAEYFPGHKGLYDVFGNVAEMTSEKGIAKGGSYMNYAIESHPDSTQYYTATSKLIGFRCIAEALPANTTRN